MKSNRIFIGCGIGTFLLSLLLLIPARVITGLVPADAAQVSGISGTLWNGSARTFRAGGMQLTDVNWQLSPLALLIGRAAIGLDADWGNGFMRGDITLGLGGSLKLTDFEATGPLGPILKNLNLQADGGELSVQVARLDLVDGWPQSLVGTARVGNLPLSVIGVAGGAMGSYSVSFEVEEVADDGAIPGALKDLGGPLEVDGTLSLTAPRDYTIDALIGARDSAPAELAQGLMLIGPKTADGTHAFQMSGSF